MAMFPSILGVMQCQCWVCTNPLLLPMDDTGDITLDQRYADADVWCEWAFTLVCVWRVVCVCWGRTSVCAFCYCRGIVCLISLIRFFSFVACNHRIKDERQNSWLELQPDFFCRNVATLLRSPPRWLAIFARLYTPVLFPSVNNVFNT